MNQAHSSSLKNLAHDGIVMNAAKQETKRYFTVAEANQRLPLVRVIVSDIVTLFRDVHERRDRLEQLRKPSDVISHGDVYSEELHQFEDELEQDIVRLEEFVAELKDLGVELKDYVTGLIDFTAIFDGREVCLCWKLGEEEIGYWHEMDAGYNGRQPLLEDTFSANGSNTVEDIN